MPVRMLKRWLATCSPRTLAASAIGVALLLLATFVMAGWLAHVPVLVRVRSDLSPVHFNTAVGFAFAGVALVALSWRWTLAARVSAAAVLTLGVVTGAQYLFGVVLGIDELFLSKGMPGLPMGRMAPNAAAAFVGGAGAALVLSRQVPTSRTLALATGLAAIPLLLGAVTLFTYAAGSSVGADWKSLVRMALPTSLGMTLLGVALLGVASRASMAVNRSIAGWVPVYVALGLAFCTVLLADAVRTDARDRQDRQTRMEAGVYRSTLQTLVHDRVRTYERMAIGLSEGVYQDTDAWTRDAALYLSHLRDDLASLAIVDRDLEIVRGVAATQWAPVEAPRSDSARRSLSEGRIAMSRSLPLDLGQPGFQIQVPFRSGAAVAGLVVATHSYQALLDFVFDQTPYAVTVLSHGDVVYQRNQPAPGVAGHSDRVEVPGETWTVSLAPTAERLSQTTQALPAAVLVFGLLLSFSIGGATHFAFTSRRRGQAMREANVRLEAEVAERTRAARQLDDISTLQRAILDSANYSLIATDAAGTIRLFNDAASRWLGYAPDEAIGRLTPSQFHDPAELEACAADVTAAAGRPLAGFDALVHHAREGRADERECWYIRRNGTRFPVQLSITPVRGDAGDVTGFLFVAADITERRHADMLRRWAEESLRRAEELLAGVLNASLTGVVAFRAVRDGDGRIIDFEWLLVNPAAERLFGKSQSYLMGRNLLDEFLDSETTLLFQQYAEVVETGLPLDIEFTTKRGGPSTWYHVVAVKLGDGLAVTFEDVTRRKEIEQDVQDYVTELETSRDYIHQQSVLLQQQAGALAAARDEAVAAAQALERALRLQADFVSFASHQLRTPLAGIKWMLELALDEPAGSDDLRSYVVDGLASAERLIGLVNDLLDASRLEGGRVAVDARTLDLGALAAEVLHDLEPHAARQAHVLAPAGLDSGASVVADRQLMRQVLMNLISNAIKYTPPGGRVAVEVCGDGAETRFVVEDSGIGVPEEARPRLFEKFFRADNVTTIETEGTGLGLYMVRLIVERFGGRIWHEPVEAGPGSRFILSLPAGSETHESGTEADPDRRGRPVPAAGV